MNRNKYAAVEYCKEVARGSADKVLIDRRKLKIVVEMATGHPDYLRSKRIVRQLALAPDNAPQ